MVHILTIDCSMLMQALVQYAVLKFKKDGKSSPKTQQLLESDTQQLLSPRSLLSAHLPQHARTGPSPANESRDLPV